nr:gdsl esterase/lipase 5 [Quercus suber]
MFKPIRFQNHTSLLVEIIAGQNQILRVCGTATPFFIFGDSTVDPGNNNYINTISAYQANYKPYGHNGFFEEPTGRFSDGRVIVDFIAEYAELPVIPPFLQPSAEFINGVNFASGGSGILPETNQGQVIDFQTQIKHFEEVQKSLTKKLGEARANELFSEAVYFISIGSNDYMGGYLGNPKMQEYYAPEEYVGLVIGNLTQAIQVLYEKGGRKFGFLSLSPLGFKYCNSNFYDWLQDRINNPSKYGFKDGVNACCGTGPYGGIFTCGGTKKVTDYQLCDNADDFVWWDSFHPTEKIHEQLGQALWNGPPSSVGPYTLQHLFLGKEELTIADEVDDPDRQNFHY